MRLCNLCLIVDVRRLALLLTVGMIGLLAAATVVERCLGTPTVERCIYHTTGFCLLWGLLGVTMLCALWQRKVWHRMPVLLLHLACVMSRRFPFVRPFGFLLSGCVLLVSYLGEMNPQITPLVPVLASPWLSTHVSSIMMAYSLLAFTWLSALLALCRHRAAASLMLFSRLLLYPALFFLAAGIFLGAVWANEAWGRYWAWDPKEVWALVTLLVYGAAFHVEALPCLRRPRCFHLYMALAFLTVLMTRFGVNCLLGGMHSYQ